MARYQSKKICGQRSDQLEKAGRRSFNEIVQIVKSIRKETIKLTKQNDRIL